MPQYCTQNNTATGAIIGGLLGAGVGAAIGGGRGAAIGGASGLALGSLTGAQADQQCRQLALQRALRWPRRNKLQRSRRQPTKPKHVGRQSPSSPSEYVTPTTGQRHKITPLSSYTNPATKETCSSFDEVSFDADGKASVTGKGRVCKGADGQVHAPSLARPVRR